MDGSESSGVKVARGHKIEDVRQRLQGEQELIARLRTANVRFSDAQTERIWAIVSAHQAGLSIRRIAGATGLSSNRIHRLLTTSEASFTQVTMCGKMAPHPRLPGFFPHFGQVRQAE